MFTVYLPTHMDLTTKFFPFVFTHPGQLNNNNIRCKDGIVDAMLLTMCSRGCLTEFSPCRG